MRRLTVSENKKRGMVLRVYIDYDTLEKLKESASKSERSKERSIGKDRSSFIYSR